MMDWRIGRLIRAHPAITAPGGSQIVLSANQQRVAVLFGLDDNFNSAAPDSISLLVDGVAGPTYQLTCSPFMISITTHGDLPTRRLVVTTSLGNLGIFAIEFTMPENYLAAGLEQFESEYARGRS